MNNSFARKALVALLLAAGFAAAQDKEKEKETVRPEVGKALIAAEELIKAKKPKEALVRIQEADAVANKTPFEAYLVERTRASVAASVGDVAGASRSFEALIASGRPTLAEKLAMMEALAGSYYRNKDYPNAIAWAGRYFKEGGADPQLHLVLIHSYFLNGEFENAAREALADIQADEKAGKTPPEVRLQLLANSYLKLNDVNRYAFALEKLVTYHPKQDYWADLIARTQRRPTFDERLSLDVMRLRMATGTLEDAEDYMEFAQMALQAGFPAEAMQVVEKGYEARLLGTGPNADRHKRMRELVEKQRDEDRKELAQKKTLAAAEANKDGIALVGLGYAMVTDGQFDAGLTLMERGIARGVSDAKRPQDAKLHLGVAYYMAGRKDKALETFPGVQGTHGAADMARLWMIRLRQP